MAMVVDLIWTTAGVLFSAAKVKSVGGTVTGIELDRELANANLVELDGMMQEIALKVNPLLPMKKLTQGKLNGFIPPKIQLKKDGTLSSHML
ncbi:MAG: hypothetical protein K2Q22_06085, partial [Cytophagales bacterium]|nr:hypothetical protein [Cytophagales bacterium]